MGDQPAIQVDAFEVGLGSAILIQIRHDSGPVSILADAGYGARIESTRVRDRLPEAFAAFGNHTSRIDVVVATHYDGDHLKGLVPIISDTAIEIGEIWLPPVANDTESIPPGVPLSDEHMLGDQFRNPTRAIRYAQAKATQLEEWKAMGRELEAGPDSEPSQFETRTFEFQSPDEAILHFQAEWRELGLADPERPDPADWTVESPRAESRPRPPALARYEEEFLFNRRYQLWDERGRPRLRHLGYFVGSGRVELLAEQLRYAKKATVKQAITALHLNCVVEALVKHRPKLPVVFSTINAGDPQWYHWDAGLLGFVAGTSQDLPAPIGIVQLGPSSQLVKDHQARLPVWDLAGEALERLSLADVSIPVRPITPNNELSYVLVITALDQRVLITGDAGMVDFVDDDKELRTRLVDELKKIDVLQIAHHGGSNKYFYHSLAAADFGRGHRTLAILSHGPHDPHRPNDALAALIAAGQVDPDMVRLVFTNRPRQDRVRALRHLVEPAAGASTGESGDIRIVYTGGRWETTRHGVSLA